MSSDNTSTSGESGDYSLDGNAISRGRAYVNVMAAKSGNEKPDLSDEEAADVGMWMNETMTRLGARSHRRRGMSDVGTSHDGERDIWKTLGYPPLDSVGPQQYKERYLRQDVARAIISQPVETTWRKYPKISDDLDPETQTEFEADLQTLIDGNHLERGFLHYCEWSDRRQRIGQYGLLVLGLDDGERLDQPVNEGNIEGPKDLRYLMPLSQAEVSDWDLAGPDSMDREPGLPRTYTIQFKQPDATGQNKPKTVERDVHHSRVVHLVEQPEDSELTHTPVLQPVLNRLIDLEKVIGASAEMYWSSADRKFVGRGEGAGLTEEDVERFDEQMYEMVNGMRTSAVVDNMELDVIDGQSVDPTGIIQAILKQIASVVGMPMRKLIGSERGDLASSMDERTWRGKISERQSQFCEPVILRETVDRLITFGVLSPPANGTYTIDWPIVSESDEKDRSEIHYNESRAVKAAEEAIALGAPRTEVYERLNFDAEIFEEGADARSETGERPVSDIPEDDPGTADRPAEGDDSDSESDSESDAGSASASVGSSGEAAAVAPAAQAMFENIRERTQSGYSY